MCMYAYVYGYATAFVSPVFMCVLRVSLGFFFGFVPDCYRVSFSTLFVFFTTRLCFPNAAKALKIRASRSNAKQVYDF